MKMSMRLSAVFWDQTADTRKIEIHYSFVVPVGTLQPAEVINHDRKNMADIKSIAI